MPEFFGNYRHIQSIVLNSLGRAAEFAGMSRISFLQILAQFGTPIFDLTKGELERDLDNA